MADDGLAFDELLWRVVQQGGIFFLLDSFLSWSLWGCLVVQIINYSTALKTTLRRERVWQQWSIFGVFAVSTIQTFIQVYRVINVEVTHYGQINYLNHYRQQIAGPIVYYLGILVITSVQLLVRERTIRLRKSIWIGRPNRIQLTFTNIATVMQPVTTIAAVTSYALVLRVSTYSAIVREVERPDNVPWFLVCQIFFNVGCLSLSVIKSISIAYDVLEAKRSTTTSHPNAQKTFAVLRDLWQVSAQNSIIVVLTHTALLVALFYSRSSVAGRPCTTLSAVYAHSLLSQVLQPQLTLRRQAFEDSSADGGALPQHHSASSGRKHLFGLRLKRTFPRRGKTTTPTVALVPAPSALADEGSSAAVGFFTLLRGGMGSISGVGGAGVRRRSSVAVTGTAGVQRIVEVRSYVNYQADFDDIPATLSSSGGALRLHMVPPTLPVVSGSDIGRSPSLAKEISARTEDRERPASVVRDEHNTEKTHSWAARGERLALGNACWVDTALSHRPLTARSHARTSSLTSPSLRSAPGVPSLSHPAAVGCTQSFGAPAPTDPTASFQSTRSTGGARSLLRAPLAPIWPPSSSRASLGLAHDERDEPGGEIAFIQSFPTGAILATAYEAYDPDMYDSLSLPPFALSEGQQQDQQPHRPAPSADDRERSGG